MSIVLQIPFVLVLLVVLSLWAKQGLAELERIDGIFEDQAAIWNGSILTGGWFWDKTLRFYYKGLTVRLAYRYQRHNRHARIRCQCSGKLMEQCSFAIESVDVLRRFLAGSRLRMTGDGPFDKRFDVTTERSHTALAFLNRDIRRMMILYSLPDFRLTATREKLEFSWRLSVQGALDLEKATKFSLRMADRWLALTDESSRSGLGIDEYTQRP